MKILTLLIVATLGIGLIVSAGSAQSGKKVESIYTDLTAEKCKNIESDDTGSGYSRDECPGVGGYKLQVIESDIRQTIDIISPDGKKSELNFQRNVSSAFSETGAIAEWRVIKSGKDIKPIALIVRYNASEDPTSDKVTSRLIVVKINGGSACITDVVEPIRNANAIARKLADKSGKKPCKFPAAEADEQQD